MKRIIIIPSRLASTRLPNKPLADICGLPMIVRVCKQAEKLNYENNIGENNIDIYVASADEEICEVVEKFGFKSIITDKNLASGTDRIHQALLKIEEKNNIRYDYIVNLQGDLPTVEPIIISSCLNLIENKTENFDITTAVNKFHNNQEVVNPNDVKVAIAWKNKNSSISNCEKISLNEKENYNEQNLENISFGNALYFSRSVIPHNAEDYYHHIGIYAFTRNALEKFVKLPVSTLEKCEKLEQLRALENNMKIGVCEVSQNPVGVDTIEDLEKVKKIISLKK